MQVKRAILSEIEHVEERLAEVRNQEALGDWVKGYRDGRILELEYHLETLRLLLRRLPGDGK